MCLTFAGQAGYAGTIDILTDDRRAAQKRAALETALDAARDRVETLFGRRLKGGFTLIGAEADTITATLDRTYARRGQARPRIPIDLPTLCGSRWANAIASVDFILVCWPEGTEIQPGDPRLGMVVAHELMHHMQYDLIGLRTDRNVPRPGPGWLVEGSAEVVEYLYRRGVLPDDGPDFFDLQTAARRSRLTLRDLAAPGSVRAPEAYGVARFAGVLLAQRHGLDAFVRYFRDLGAGKTRAQAFRRSFGETEAQFEARFERLRRSYGAAKAWASRDRRRTEEIGE